ncbi:MAG: Unknown protein [uncultured Sulfurovum sp.]|uniref:Uncharacterized protein n=1 Tax=uncultured Sulfurovum sp. TaxID=269237 RepID=A0A6S6TY35_9BACT|nr:MAG: Unknown protein [uncultured Sulfurovum sp.]
MFLLSYSTAAVVVPDDYLMSDDKALTYVYTQEHVPVIAKMKVYQEALMDGYEKEFGYKLDDKMYVGLASSKNQIANGFSTQIPFNSQILYGAGATYIDYFSSSSWLKTLLIHETAHNFQLNPKENFLSQSSHKLLGNTPVSFLAFIPLFPIPNVLENNFILEGNGVMNESRFGNGGRLFSGYALAELLALVQADGIKPELMINPTLSFPYGEKFYLVGGFFQQFLVDRYGIDKVNGYFKTFATQPFPFFSSAMFKKQYGKTFEQLLAEFVDELKLKHEAFKSTEGTLLTRSETFVPLNKQNNAIYTLISDNKSAPKVFELNIKTMTSSFEEGAWRLGELVKKEGAYYSQASGKTSPTKIEMGLFDKEGYMKKGFEGKAIQGFTASGKEVYFDVKQSIEAPQVYVDGNFYTESHSSVHVDQENLYYFKQENATRTLYKNKKALVAFEGHYGFVTDVDSEGVIYFVASSKHGSSVYRVRAGVIERVMFTDDVIDFKLIGDNQAFVVTIDAKGYAYRKVDLQRVETAEPYKINIAQNGRLAPNLRETDFLSPKEVLSSESYNSLKALSYSSLSQLLSYEESRGLGVDLQANFADPLLQNSLALVLSHDDDRDILGLRYDNQVHQLEYGFAGYKLFKNNESQTVDKREHGYDAYLRLPFIKRGYWDANLILSYTEDYDTIYRKPLSFALNVLNAKHFAYSKYVNALNALSLFGTSDREVNLWGGTYAFKQGLAGQSYLGLRATYMKSNEVNFLEEKGIELREGLSTLQSDSATLSVPSFSSTLYAKELNMAELSLAKVFDGSLYFFSFPLSLQRESLYVKQRRYDIDFSDSIQRTYYERIVGTELDLVLFNKLEFPLRLEWINNEDVVDKDKLRVLIGGSF